MIQKLLNYEGNFNVYYVPGRWHITLGNKIITAGPPSTLLDEHLKTTYPSIDWEYIEYSTVQQIKECNECISVGRIHDRGYIVIGSKSYLFFDDLTRTELADILGKFTVSLVFNENGEVKPVTDYLS